MSTITWLHLSDLHFRATAREAWDENIVLRALIEDIRRYTDEQGLTLDFVLVSGDIAFSGKQAEYDLACTFFDQLLEVTKLTKERIFVAPGNHDANRTCISQGARAHILHLNSRQKVKAALTQEMDRRQMLHKFDNYGQFVRTYFGDHIVIDDEHYLCVRSLELADERVAVLGLNSAWLTLDDDDRNRLALGERQIRKALDASNDVDWRIALLHHPFEWLCDFDRETCEALLMSQ